MDLMLVYLSKEQRLLRHSFLLYVAISASFSKLNFLPRLQCLINVGSSGYLSATYCVMLFFQHHELVMRQLVTHVPSLVKKGVQTKLKLKTGRL